MRVFLFVIAFLVGFSFNNDVYATHYTARSLKRYAESVPRKDENNVSTLVNYLVKRLDDDYDKAKVIAFWIAGHISYDEYLYRDGKTSKLIKGYRGQSPRELLQSRVGICGDFAELFEEMCQKAGIRAYQVHGYAYPWRKISGNKLKRSQYGHAWNYFVYKNKKVYVDTTFMAKGSIGDKGRISTMQHNRALKNVKKENKYKSKAKEFDDYYFDFDYKDEAHEKHYIHQEK